jgi:hypothetical protein
MASQYLFKEAFMNTNNFEQSISVSDENAAVPRARLITDYYISDYCITDYTININLPVDRSALVLPSASRGVNPERNVIGYRGHKSFGNELGPLEYNLAQHDIAGIRLTLGESVSMNSNKPRVSKGSYRGHIDIQYASQISQGLYNRYTSYLTLRRRNFAQEAVNQVCERVLDDYDMLRYQGAKHLLIGHIHPKQKKCIIEDLGLLVNIEAKTAHFYYETHRYDFGLDDDLSVRQQECRFILQGDWGRISAVPRLRQRARDTIVGGTCDQ